MQLVRNQPERENVVGWLYTVAKHEAFAALGRDRRATPVDELPQRIGSEGPETQVEARETLRLIGELRPQQRLALLLRAEGFSYQEIADRTGKTYTWVNRHLTEGRRAARLLDEQ